MGSRAERSSGSKIGLIGLGIMGQAYAKNLIERGFSVAGFDVAPEQTRAFEALGGESRQSPKNVAAISDVILMALPSVQALEAAVAGPEGLALGIRPGAVVAEMGTLPLEAKEAARSAIEARGAFLLDCPVSGTGAQAAVRDLVIYASGDAGAFERARPAFGAVGREARFVGPFGAGIKLKYIANLLVTIHNLASAEALLLAKQAGLDLEMVFDAISSGAGTSRMFEVRGPMMVEETYEPATMKMEVHMKDLRLILDYAREVGCPTPLLAATLPFYVAGLAAGRGRQDTAALFGVLQDMVEKKETKDG